jgi:hypothetical protein
MVIKHTSRGLKQDIKRRSKQSWERGKGARKIGNPRYKPKRIRGKDDVIRKIYCLRAR